MRGLSIGLENNMDRTLADYIKRVTGSENPPVPTQPKENPDQYLVYPEKRSEDSDEKINPYSQV